MKLTLSDDLQYRIALVRWTAERNDQAALTQQKLELADAVVDSVADRQAPSRLARLRDVRRPRPVAAGTVPVVHRKKRRPA